MNDKEAIERCKELIKETHSCWIGISNQDAIKTVLNLIKKQEEVIKILNEGIKRQNKQIDLMANHLEKHSTFFAELYGAKAKDWKQYFEKKAEIIPEENLKMF